MTHNYYSLNLNSLIKRLSLFCLLLVSQSHVTNATTPVKADRWLEIDLYWFEHKDMEASVNTFWDRFYPLMEGVEGWKGVILNVGWISDYIADNIKYGAFPGGIPEGTPFTEFFGKQWGSLSKATELDLIVLRDSYLGVGIYLRTGPYGKTAPVDSKKVIEWSNATNILTKRNKLTIPKEGNFYYW